MLRDEVARAVSIAIGADGASPHVIADAAITIVLERAAGIADMWAAAHKARGKKTVSDAEAIAAVIRSLQEQNKESR